MKTAVPSINFVEVGNLNQISCDRTKILTYAKENPKVYLPSHDPDGMTRLIGRITVEVKD